MDPSTRASLIERYRSGYAQVAEALAGVSEVELDARPVDGGWTAREVAHHLADSETTSYIRLRRLLAQDRPDIQGYDEAEFARRLWYDRRVGVSLEVFRTVRESSAEILERLSEGDWSRGGVHSEIGQFTVETWLELYAAHAFDHAEQIRRSRASIERPEARG
ncbi:MAG TPA: DinB family protein [Chloroflexota bacterium]|nr:DinB family protein [Chloroflexota bacterium]